MLQPLTSVIVSFLSRFLFYPVVIILVFNLIQRRFVDRGTRKRYASLYFGVLVLAFWGVTFLFQRYGIPDGYLILPLSAAAALIAIRRKDFLPFRLRCASCGKRLSLRTVLFDDANLCDSCGVSDEKE
jgi:hypothetical protein